MVALSSYVNLQSARGRRFHVRLRDGCPHRGELWLHHGGRDGIGQDVAVHHTYVDAAQTGAGLQAAHREGHCRRSKQFSQGTYIKSFLKL